MSGEEVLLSQARRAVFHFSFHRKKQAFCLSWLTSLYKPDFLQSKNAAQNSPCSFSVSEQNDKPGYVVEWPSIHFCRRRQTLATYPKADGPPYAFCSVLLRMGFTCAPPVASRAVVSYTALSTLTRLHLLPRAVYFCCTVPGVASARRYLASCPVKPDFLTCGFRHLQSAAICLTRKI